ncbi:MAG TPA: DUF2914 domain-containing protein [Candidatus Paceibacterota bacterium]|jgi:hypothetical protein
MPRLLAFIRRNESRLSTLVFLTGFITDLITFTVLDLPAVNLLFLAYLVTAACFIFLTHAFQRFADRPSGWQRTIATLSPLGAAFTIGGLLSGFVIFYTKSAVLSVSWPFLLLLLGIFVGNEFARSYRAHLAFQTVLFFFALYAYLIFAFPLYADRLGERIFVESTTAAAVIFFGFLFLLACTGFRRLTQTLPYILTGTAIILFTIPYLYLSGIIPPLPLALKDQGVFHQVVRTQDGYQVTFEGGARWSRYVERTIHHVPGTPLYAFASVFAPRAFSTNIVHRWQRYDSRHDVWVTESKLAFRLTGGRKGGYRGYSIKNDPAPGLWRVSIETVEGQVIGQMRFHVVNVAAPPKLYMQTR